MKMPAVTLPGLLYVGDVPVESSYHGSALLYRLLQNYPGDRLQIVEAGLHASLPERRLKSVQYHFHQLPLARLHYTRFAKLYVSLVSLSATRRAAVLLPLCSGFKPEAILTVTHGYSWITAARLAQKLAVPLHLICHDDWPRIAMIADALRNWLDAKFGRVYRQANSRFCVSPFMVEAYERRYTVRGVVLYPSRAPDCRVFASPPERLGRNDHRFTCAFAGTVNYAGYVELLNGLAKTLRDVDGQLLIFGPLGAQQARAMGLTEANMEVRGLLNSAKLIMRLREEGDALFVPMSFAAAAKANMQISFPSKLADYTAAGVPLLICGPDYCSAVRWARENPGVAEVIMNEDPAELATAVNRLRDPAHRIALAKTALQKGDQFFSHAAAEKVFLQALLAGRSA
jgi:glycosyltransferase involved in cell wall biosynthesis